MKSLSEMEARVKKLATAIEETEARLPAHAVKPPVMIELLELEDAYEALALKIRSLRAGLSERPVK